MYSIRIPGAGSYPNIESRDSPVGGSCNYVNETTASTAAAVVATATGQASVSSEPKLIYKKSVFKKKSTSSTATVSRTYIQLRKMNVIHLAIYRSKVAFFKRA